MKKLYFVFCKDDLLIEQLSDGSYTIPYQEEPPTEVKPWTHLMNVSPMADGTPVVTYRLETPPSSPSTIHTPPSTLHTPQSTIHHPLSTIHHPPSTIHYPPSTIHYPLSTIHYPLPPSARAITSWSDRST